MQISEIFYSIQGEGRLVGTPSAFIRIAGCSLRCRYCDTKYAWDSSAGTRYSIEQIIDQIEQFDCKYVVITGGEPMTAEQLPQLTQQLKKSAKHITIETAGIAFVPDLPCDLMSISPKLTNSTPADTKLAEMHERSRLQIPVLGRLIDNYDCQLKFVVDSPTDLQEIQDLLNTIGLENHEKVFLMPQAQTRDQLLAKSTMTAEMCKQTGFNFGQRLQILLWNNKRAT